MKKIILILITSVSLVTETVGQSLPSYVPTNGLIGWYPFNSNANDTSGNGNNGTVNGVTLTTDRNGKTNSAYSFTKNSTDRISLPTVKTNNIIKYSIAGWFQYNINGSPGGTIFAQSNACNGINGLRFYMGADNKLYWDAEFNGQSNCSGKGTHQSNNSYTSDNNWHFFAATFDGVNGLIHANKFKIYIDNILVSQLSDSTSGGILDSIKAPIISSSLSTTIGNLYGWGDPFKGKIDDIGIWNRVLTTGEMTNLFNSKVVNVNSVIKAISISLFPNPSHNQITIELGNITNLSGYQVKITNTLGQQVYQSEITQQQFTIDLSNTVGIGIYFAQIFDGEGKAIGIKKIVLQ